MHGTHVELSISACIDKKNKVPTTIDGNTAYQEGQCEKGCEIQGDGQEMAVMVG